MYSPGSMDGGQNGAGRHVDLTHLEERLAELERLAEALEGVPDAQIVEVLEGAVALLAEINAGIEAGLRASEGEARKLGDLLEAVDFGPFDKALENLERPSGGDQ